MIYLNDVEEGGATWFPQAGVRFAPEARAAARLEQHDAGRQPQPRDAARGHAGGRRASNTSSPNGFAKDWLPNYV